MWMQTSQLCPGMDKAHASVPQTTARNIWEDSWRMLTADQRCCHVTTWHWRRRRRRMVKGGTNAQKKKLSQSWLQKSELWRAYKLFLSWDWSVRGDEVDRWHPLPYLVLWINLLIFCCCCRSRYPGEGAQVQQNLFHSCLAVQERWIGKGQESKRNWGHMTYKHFKIWCLLRCRGAMNSLFVVSLPFASHKSYCK